MQIIEKERERVYMVSDIVEGIIHLDVFDIFPMGPNSKLDYRTTKSSISYHDLISELNQLESQRQSHFYHLKYPNDTIPFEISNQRYTSFLSILSRIEDEEYNKRVN
jgi:hypothetical protein